MLSLFVSAISAGICACAESHQAVASDSCHSKQEKISHTKNEHHKSSAKHAKDAGISKANCDFCKRSINSFVGTEVKSKQSKKSKHSFETLTAVAFEFKEILHETLEQNVFADTNLYKNPISFFKPSRSPPVL